MHWRKKSETSKEAKEEVDPFVAEKIKAGVPIDHGWAWMCVVSCCLMNMLVSGTFRSQGIIYVELLELFEGSSAETIWVFSIAGLFVNILAPFSNSFAVRFSSRAVVMTGGLLVTSAMLLSHFATSLRFLYFSYGVLVGMGYGLVYAPSITVVGYYFHKRRALANGLSVAGSSIGSLFMPVVTAFLIDEFSIKGAFILLAGIMLHLCVSAALLRPMEFYVERTERWQAESPDAARNASWSGKDVPKRGLSTGDVEEVGQFRVIPVSVARLDSVRESEEYEASSVTTQHNVTFKGIGDSQRWQSLSILQISSTMLASNVVDDNQPVRTRSCTDVFMKKRELGSDRDSSNSMGEPGIERRVSDSDIGSAQNTLGERTVPIFSESALQAVRKELVRLEQNKVLKRNRPLSYSFRRLLSPRLVQAKEVLVRSGSSLVASVPDLTFASMQNLPHRFSTSYQPEQSRGFFDSLLTFCKIRQKVAVPGKVGKGKGVPILDPWILRQPSFYLLSIAMSICITVFMANFMLIPTHMSEGLGVPRIQGAKVLQFIGITDLCGRLFIGWFADLNLIPRKSILIGSFIGEGIISLLVPFAFTSYGAMIAYALLIGMFGGFISPLTAVVICDTIGIRRLSSAFGLSMLIFGASAIIIPPALGFVRDLTGSWDAAFYINGCLCFFSALLAIIEVFISRRWPINKKDEEVKLAEKSNLIGDAEA